MKIWQGLVNMVQYLWQGTVRLFSPNDDDYPETGVQPYEGESYEER
ncbi:hypothetical protein STA3757_21360 [Stanieria sp. NIES-3757]|nr:hypothetical protein STA3757_21360 [Stanieria sp. NIES-3757]